MKSEDELAELPGAAAERNRLAARATAMVTAAEELYDARRNKLTWAAIIAGFLLTVAWITISAFAYAKLKADLSTAQTAHVYQIGKGAYGATEASRDFDARDRRIQGLADDLRGMQSRMLALEKEVHGKSSKPTVIVVKPTVVTAPVILPKASPKAPVPVVAPPARHWWEGKPPREVS